MTTLTVSQWINQLAPTQSKRERGQWLRSLFNSSYCIYFTLNKSRSQTYKEPERGGLSVIVLEHKGVKVGSLAGWGRWVGGGGTRRAILVFSHSCKTTFRKKGSYYQALRVKVRLKMTVQCNFYLVCLFLPSFTSFLCFK